MELQILDPFGDYETAGYLRNIYQEKNLRLVGHLETAAFEQEVLSTVRFLRRLPTLRYQHITETHHRLFNALYPWAGQDRSINAPDIAIAKGGYSDLFAHKCLDTSRTHTRSWRAMEQLS
jgi:cell filamentation protein